MVFVYSRIIIVYIKIIHLCTCDHVGKNADVFVMRKLCNTIYASSQSLLTEVSNEARAFLRRVSSSTAPLQRLLSALGPLKACVQYHYFPCMSPLSRGSTEE